MFLPQGKGKEVCKGRKERRNWRGSQLPDSTLPLDNCTSLLQVFGDVRRKLLLCESTVGWHSSSPVVIEMWDGIRTGPFLPGSFYVRCGMFERKRKHKIQSFLHPDTCGILAVDTVSVMDTVYSFNECKWKSFYIFPGLGASWSSGQRQREKITLAGLLSASGKPRCDDLNSRAFVLIIFFEHANTLKRPELQIPSANYELCLGTGKWGMF